MTVLEALASAPQTYVQLREATGLSFDALTRELDNLVAQRKITRNSDGKSPATYELKK